MRNDSKFCASAYNSSHSLVTAMNLATRLASRPCPVPSTLPTIHLLPYPQYCRCFLPALSLQLLHILNSKSHLPRWELHHFQGTIQICFVLLKFLALLRLLLPIQAIMSFFPVQTLRLLRSEFLSHYIRDAGISISFLSPFRTITSCKSTLLIFAISESKHQPIANSTRHSISGSVMVESTTGSASWHDYAPSPYSCSSGYATPAPGLDYSHAYASPPYINNVVRTRASSNASLIEQHWAQASQSPTSSVGMPYPWPSDEKNIAVSSFPYTTGSYSVSDMPMYTMMPSITHYGAYDPQNVVQMDAEEGVHLFPGDQYGMSEIMRAFPSEQRLNYYWRLFHPTFPVVHRSTSVNPSPMLRAAMVAIGSQYSTDSSDKKKGRDLHDRCLKLLERVG